LARLVVQIPQARTVRAEILDDPSQTTLDLPIDRAIGARRERAREVRQESLEFEALGEAPLRSSTLRPLDEQRRNESGLQEQQGDANGDVGMVAFPHRWLVEEDHAAGREGTTIDAPALDLAIVEHRNHGAGGGGLRTLPREHAPRELRRRLAVCL